MSAPAASAPARQSFLAALDQRVLVCDGAMGTMLYGRGVFINRCFESLNLSQPDLVREVHQQYARAGADIIESNTFGANRVKLRAFGLGDKVHEIAVRGAQLARQGAGEHGFVAGAIGPLGIRIEPWGKTGVDEAESYFREQAEGLLDGGVDLFVLETFRDLNEIGAAIRAVRSLCDLPIVAQMTTDEDANTLDGTPPEQFAPALVQMGAQVVGVNCSVGPAAMLETIERLAQSTPAWLAAQPNAGQPRDIEGRNIYLCSPEYMASYARRFISTRVRLVGGCCGTTPDHIRQIALAVKRLTPPTVRTATATVLDPPADPHSAVTPVARDRKSWLSHALAKGRRVRAVELPAPKGHNCAEAMEQARELRRRGVDVAMVPDTPRGGGSRMSAWALAVLVQQSAGLETVLQYSCRDRNLLGIQSDLLGAHALGLRNLLGITGDVRSLGEIPDATAVFDVDSIGLTNLISRLNTGLDIGAQPIGAPTAFHAGVMVDPGASNFDEELRRFAYKVEAGAEFAITRPVFDLRAFERFVAQIKPFAIPLIVGVWPFESVLNAEFMANELPGVTVPSALLERMRGADGADAAAAEGVAIARELARELEPLAQGLHIAAPSGRVALALDVIDGLV